MGRKVSLFLDSGAHSLYTQLIKKEGYGYAETQAFWDYVDNYAAFVKKYEKHIDVYVNVDVIRNSDMTLKVQKYLEEEHGLHPLPVVHYGVTRERLIYYMDRHEYIGIGGLGQVVTKSKFRYFCDGVFDVLTDDAGRPLRKVHGFAVTSFELLFRYPWYSVDSSSWCTHARFGSVIVPKKRQGKRVYAVDPLGRLRDSVPSIVNVSGRVGQYEEQKADSTSAMHINNLTEWERQDVLDYFEEQSFRLGKSEYRTESSKYKAKEGELKFGVFDNDKLCKVEVTIEKGLSNSIYEREQLNVLYFLEVEKVLTKRQPLFCLKAKRQRRLGFGL